MPVELARWSGPACRRTAPGRSGSAGQDCLGQCAHASPLARVAEQKAVEVGDHDPRLYPAPDVVDRPFSSIWSTVSSGIICWPPPLRGRGAGTNYDEGV